MPAVTPTLTRHHNPPASTAGVNRLVLTQMLACGVLGWAIFALAVDRWLPNENVPEQQRIETVARQISGPSSDSISVQSAQFPVNDRHKNR